MKKFVSLLLSFTLLLCLIGCSKTNPETVAEKTSTKRTVNYGVLKYNDGHVVDVEIDWSLFDYFANYRIGNALNSGYDAESLKSDLSAVQENGKTGADLAKESCLADIKSYYAVHILAKQHDISLNAEDKKTLAEEKDAQIQLYGGRDAFLSTLASNHMTEAHFDFLQETSALYNKLLTALFGEGGEYEISQEDIIADVSENYVRVVHILVQADATSEDFAEKTAYANEILARANAGEDFMALVAELSEDPGSQSQPDGYIFDRNGNTMDGSSMVTEFVEGSWALEVGQHSGLVQTDFGYHIIKRLPLDDAYITSNYDQFHSYAASDALSDELSSVMSQLSFETNDAFAAFDITALIPADTTANQ